MLVHGVVGLELKDLAAQSAHRGETLLDLHPHDLVEMGPLHGSNNRNGKRASGMRQLKRARPKKKDHKS